MFLSVNILTSDQKTYIGGNRHGSKKRHRQDAYRNKSSA